MKSMGDVECRLPEGVERIVALGDVQRLHVDLGEPGLLQQLAHMLGVAERIEVPGREFFREAAKEIGT